MTSQQEQRLHDLLTERTGLRLGPSERKNFLPLLQQKGGRDLAGFLELLQSQTPQASSAWSDVAEALTISETYFFRDQGQIELLRRRILPEILRKPHPPRVWSAGCSTGEEAYTLAMMLDELAGPSPAGSLLLATDISQASLDKAARGVYSEWSFRAQSPGPMFRKFGKDWEVSPDLRSRVTFARHNLLSGQPPPFATSAGFDLIICRNVLIYFSPEAIARTVENFYKTLRPGGYLITGHGELHSLQDARWQKMYLEDSAVYQRPSPAQIPEIPLAAAPSAPPAPRSILAPAAIVEDARHLVARGRYAEASEKLEQILTDKPDDIAALNLAVQTWANSRQFQKGRYFCRRALERKPLDSQPYFLLAQIAQEEERLAEAAEMLQKALYLDPNFIAAHLELAALFEMDGDHARARRQRSAALSSVRRLPPETLIPPYEGLTARELIMTLSQAGGL